MNSFAVVLLIAAFVVSDAFGHIALKLGTRGLEDASGQAFWTRYLASPWVISALTAWGLSVVLWVSVLKKAPLSQAFSMASVKYVVVCLAAALVLKETISARQALGMVLIGAGVLLVKLD